MQLTTKQLELVVHLTDYGSLTEAAPELNLTPSALSHQLRQLEEATAIPLFTRTKQGLIPTQAGRLVYDLAREQGQAVRRVERRLTELASRDAYRYTHGYSGAESSRLLDQASTVAEFIHSDSYWVPGSTILEVGCGVGAQTRIIAAQNPDCTFCCLDLSEASIDEALGDTSLQRLENVEFRALAAERAAELGRSFDHVFICFVLEHVPDPVALLRSLRGVLRPGGTVTVVEGDHGSTYFYPDSELARRAVAAQVRLQHANGGNANIGRALQPLLREAGFGEVRVSPRLIYVDDNNPELKENFILKTFTSMIAGIRDRAVEAGLEPAAVLDRGIRDLRETNRPGGTFSYTFLKATATV